MSSIAIQASEIGKWFGEGDARTVALRGVSLEAHFGEMLYIVGPSGSGKTTLLSILSGVLRPDAGTVSVEGSDLWALNPDELADIRKRVESDPAIEHAGDILTLCMGPHNLIINMGVCFLEGTTDGQMHEAIRRIETDIRSSYPQAERIYNEAESLEALKCRV